MYCTTRNVFCMQEQIKVGFCIAYDWYLLEHSLPLVYDAADIICLSLDKKRISWSGKKYDFDEVGFNDLIKRIDTQHKVQVLEADFSLSSLSPMQNEVRQRNRMAEFMGKGGWHIQLDCDEYFIHFSDFVKYLRELPQRKYSYNVCCPLITLFKQVEEGFLYVVPNQKEKLEYIQIATLTPNYKYGRRNGDFNVYTNFLIMHQSWARTEKEIRQKIKNWGHNKDFDQSDFFSRWIGLNGSNYHRLKNFHPMVPDAWSQLKLNKSHSIITLLTTFVKKDFPSYPTWQLFIKNSLLFSRVRAFWKKMLSRE